jgi:HAD superfamily hydrolase (TIGR01490 family)
MKAAAFYDVDGTLVSTNVVHTYAYYAVNVPSVRDKLRRTAGLVAALPFYAVADKVGRKFFNDVFYRNYAGMNEDRLHVLGEEMFDRFLRPRLFPTMLELIRRSKDEGYRQVIVTGALDTIVRPMAAFLGVDDWVANRLEIVDGVATGRLDPPVLAGPEKASWVRHYIARHGFDPEECRAYADSASDIPMLSAVGRPCAVNPDTTLSATANAHDWPTLWVGDKARD